jgi:hypothetical protein
MTEPRQFSLVLRAAPGVADPARELRALLKVALRRHGFRCLLLTPEPHRQDGENPPASDAGERE